ncbi:Motile sperm domain-containing protein 1, variant 2 [Dermatophagoides farinae]|uniref:Motile sperm domain-containing protein 1, variant 2 n=1 Tax=Dermatophagoides farinae TaxID=6954 RepID=A0A922L8Y5_DERFA|nr:Motile sperm domain-containing protein 1, variant 2 [Dermatophagoides farinae]
MEAELTRLIRSAHSSNVIRRPKRNISVAMLFALLTEPSRSQIKLVIRIFLPNLISLLATSIHIRLHCVCKCQTNSSNCIRSPTK